MVVDALAALQRAAFFPGRGDYYHAMLALGKNDVMLMKPTTYINNSGIAILEASQRFEVSLENILVVIDDFHLPLGKLRIRPSGSDGGHHGLESVIYQLQTDHVPRLRCGIGPDQPMTGDEEKIDFVLSPFNMGELPVVRQMIARAAEAVEAVIVEGIPPAMSRFNGVE